MKNINIQDLGMAGKRYQLEVNGRIIKEEFRRDGVIPSWCGTKKKGGVASWKNGWTTYEID